MIALALALVVVVILAYPAAGLYAIVSADRRIHRGHRRPSRSVVVRLFRQWRDRP